MKTQKTLNLILFLVVIVFITKPLTSEANKNALDKKIITPLKEMQVDTLLKLFSEQTGFEFSFNSDNISQSAKTPPVTKRSNTLLRWLDIDKQKLNREVERALDKKHAIQLTGGYSRHGSGDMKGIVFGTEYIRYSTKRFSLNYNIRATINSGKDEYIVNNLLTNTRTDASVRYTTAGVQLGVNAGWSFIKTERHDFKISVGPFGRYQSASNGSDGYSVYYPQATGMPAILIGYDNRTAQETFAVGGILQIQYDYTFSNKIYIGVTPGFQTDTNGDAILHFACTVGRRI